jgi:hypothetical protein
VIFATCRKRVNFCLENLKIIENLKNGENDPEVLQRAASRRDASKNYTLNF